MQQWDHEYNIVETVRTYGNMSIIVNSRNSGNKNNTGNSGIFSPTVPTVTTVPCGTHVPTVSYAYVVTLLCVIPIENDKVTNHCISIGQMPLKTNPFSYH